MCIYFDIESRLGLFLFALDTSPVMENNRKDELIMDELKMKLSTKFMRGIVSKLIAKAISKKLGYKVDIQLNDLDISVIDGDANINANVEVKINNEEFMKIMKSIV